MLELRTRSGDDRPRSEPHPARATVAMHHLRGVERDRTGRMLAVRKRPRR